MLKKYIILIFILLFANNLLAVDNAQKSINDSTDFSKFNIHAGVGVINGTRFGINYRFNKHISFNVDYGGSTLFILYPPFWNISVFSTDINYHFSQYSGSVLSISYANWGSIVPNKNDFLIFLTPNLGYIFYNRAKTNSLQIRIGAGAWFCAGKDCNDSNVGIWPNLDIILNIHLNKD